MFLDQVNNSVSLKWKILVPMAVLGALALVALESGVWVTFTEHKEHDLKQRAELLARSIIYAAESIDGETELDRYIMALGGQRDVEMLILVEPEEGRVIGSTKFGWSKQLLSDVISPELVARIGPMNIQSREEKELWIEGKDNITYILHTPILHFTRGTFSERGIVYIQLSTNLASKKIIAVTRNVAIGVSLGLFAFLILLLALIYDIVLKPVELLQLFAERRTYAHDMMDKLSRRPDELGALARTLTTTFHQIEKNAERLSRLAQRDTLTGLGNRTMFRERLKAAIHSADRSDRNVVLMILDLDNFKIVNDTLGHAVGDALLKDVASTLREHTRATDTVVRLGGDEFAIISGDIDKPERLYGQAQRILKALCKSRQVSGHPVQVGSCIGITVFPQDGHEPDVLLKNADLALYRAKEEGGSNIQLFRHELHLKAVERNAIEQDLRQAIKEEQFELYFQPKVDLKTGRIIGAEALSRWNHPERGMVMPDVFIPVAEQTGLVADITKWSIAESCRQARNWRDRGLESVSVAVNVSALDLQKRELTDLVSDALVSSGLPSRYLELEVTESMFMHDIEAVINTLRRLRSLGVGISIDDFGTGYSSLSYLKKLPVKCLKIDRSFIQDMRRGTDSIAIPKLLVDLSRSLGVRVIAEGVEKAEQADILREIGCDEVQGYYYGRPMPMEEFVHFVKQSLKKPTEKPENKYTGLSAFRA